MSLIWIVLEQLTSAVLDHVADGIGGVLNSGATQGGVAQDVTNVVGTAGAAGGIAGAVAPAGAGAGAAGAGAAGIAPAARPSPDVRPKYYSPEQLEQIEKQKRYDQYKRQHLPADRLSDDWQPPGTPKNKVGFSESDIREARKVAQHVGGDPETYLPNGGGLPGGPAMSWAAGKILGPVLGDFVEFSMRAANASGLVQDLTPPVENWNPDPDGWDPTGGGGFTGPDGTSGYNPGPNASGGGAR